MSITTSSINGYSTAQLYQMSGSRTEHLSQAKDANKIQKFNYSAQSGMTIETNIDNDTLQISQAGQAAYSMSQEQQNQYESATNESDTDGELSIYEELRKLPPDRPPFVPEEDDTKEDETEEYNTSNKIVFRDESVEIA